MDGRVFDSTFNDSPCSFNLPDILDGLSQGKIPNLTRKGKCLGRLDNAIVLLLLESWKVDLL